MLRRSFNVFSRKLTSSAAPVSSALNQRYSTSSTATSPTNANATSNSHTSSASHAHAGPSRRVFITNLPWEMHWGELKEVMTSAGQVEHAAIFRDANGRSRGLGLVQFQTSEEAANAVQLFNDKSVNGRVLSVRPDEKPEDRSVFAVVSNSEKYWRQRREEERMERQMNKPNDEDKEKYQVYVGNLPYTATWHQIRGHFERAGPVTFVRLLRRPDGRPRGIGFVRFASPECVPNAVKLFDGADFMGRTLAVKARTEDHTQDRQDNQENQHNHEHHENEENQQQQLHQESQESQEIPSQIHMGETA